MTTLLFGASGQVGRELQRSLLVHGRLLIAGRDEVDLGDAASVEAAILKHRPRLIVNAAAYTAVDRAESEPALAAAVNRDAVAAMARAAAQLDALLVHYSTDYVFDGSGSTPRRPADPTGPLSVYGRTKLEGEQAISASGCRHLVLRTSWVFSSHGQNFVKTMLRLIREREQLRVVADQVGAPTSAELIADVTSLAICAHRAGRLADGIHHLSGGGETSWHGFALYIRNWAQAYGLQPKCAADDLLPIATHEYPVAAQRPANSRLDCSSLEQALGIALPHWSTHLERTLASLAGTF